MVIRPRSIETGHGKVVPINRLLARSELAELCLQGLILNGRESVVMFSLAWTLGLEKRLPGHSLLGGLGPFLPPAAQTDEHVLKLGFELPEKGWITNLDDRRLMSVAAQLPNSRFRQIVAKLPELREARLRIALEWKVAQLSSGVVSVLG